jgi:hypothetical protein
MGVLEDDLTAPFHGWLRRFPTFGRDCGIDEAKLSAIQGHAQDTEGKEYGVHPRRSLSRDRDA